MPHKRKKERPALKLDDDPLFSEWSSATPGMFAAAGIGTPNAVPSVAPYELGFDEEDEVPFVHVPPERRERLQRYVMWTVGACIAVCLAAMIRVGISRDTLSENDAAAIGAAVAAAHGAELDPVAHAPSEQAPRTASDDIPPPLPEESPEPELASSAPASAATASEPAATSSAPEPAAPAPAAPTALAIASTATTPAAVAAAPAPPKAAVKPPVTTAAAPAPAKTANEEREAARRALEHGKLREAAAAAERAATLDPSDAEAWLLLGAARQELGQAGPARSAFKSCVQSAKRGPVGECRAMLR